MSIAKLTTERQITSPKEVRDHLSIPPGSQVKFVIDEAGSVKLIPLNVPIEALVGILHRPGVRAATLEQMQAAIEEGASDWN